jgi:hypothetical protein
LIVSVCAFWGSADGDDGPKASAAEPTACDGETDGDGEAEGDADGEYEDAPPDGDTDTELIVDPSPRGPNVPAEFLEQHNEPTTVAIVLPRSDARKSRSGGDRYR